MVGWRRPVTMGDWMLWERWRCGDFFRSRVPRDWLRIVVS